MANLIREFKGLAKLGNIAAETLLRWQMFPSLAARETLLRKQILLLGNKKMLLPQVKNIFASRTQILLPKHMFPSFGTVKTMLTSFQCCSLNCFLATESPESVQQWLTAKLKW